MGQKKVAFSLQIVRIFAASIVMLYHIKFLFKDKFDSTMFDQPFNFGESGVHLFFVLSGYVMYFIHNNDIGKGLTNGKSYAWKRFIRIYPTYWVITTIVLFGMLIFPAEVKTYKANFAYIFQSYSLTEMGLMGKGLPLVTVGWSLFHEVKFYFFFFLLIIIKNDKFRRYLILTILTLTAINTIYPALMDANLFAAFYFSPLNLLFFAGAAAAWISNKQYKFLKSPVLLAISIGIYIVISIICGIQSWSVNNVTILIYGISAFLIITFFTGYEFYRVDTFGRSPFKLGKFSLMLSDTTYCLYLIHIPVYTIVIMLNKKLHLSTIPLVLAMIVSSFITAIVYYNVIERPLINLLRKIKTVRSSITDSQVLKERTLS